MIFKNDFFELGHWKWRYLKPNPNADTSWCIRVDYPNAWPEEISNADLAGLTAIELSDTEDSVEPNNCPMREERRKVSWARLEPLLLSAGDNLFDPTQRNRAIEEYAQKVGCSARTLHKDLRRYWNRGSDMWALLDDRHKSGRIQDLTPGPNGKVSFTAGRGRTAAKARYKVYQMTDVDLAAIKKVIEEDFLVKPREVHALTDSYTLLLDEHYSRQEGKRKIILPLGHRPTRRQFENILYRDYGFKARNKDRIGEDDWNRNHRGMAGTILADCLGVGHQYEIDATIGDIYLVSVEDVDVIIGKPTIYFITDRKSRLIVGFYVGLENANWECALQAILSVSEDKSELCARYDVDYNPADWPAHRVHPSIYFGDRGEMITEASGNIATGLNLTVSNTPGRRPDLKALAECGFQLMNCNLRTAPAYDPPSNVKRRRGKNFAKDACLTVRQFGKLILEHIINHNNRPILNYELSPKELLAKVVPTPISLWNHGVATRSGLLTRYEASKVRTALLRRGHAKRTERGIEFEGCVYECETGKREDWKERAREKALYVEISYDKRLVDHIYVHAGGKSGPERAELTSFSEKYRGMCFEEVAFFEDMSRDRRLESKEQGHQSRLDYRTATQPTVDAAKARLKKNGTRMSRKGRKDEAKPHREAARRQERQSTASMVPATQRQGPVDSPAHLTAAPSIPYTAPAPGSAAALAAAAQADF